MAPSSESRKLDRFVTMRVACLAALLVLSGLPAAVASADETVLYDGVTPTALPDTQGWVYVANPISGASATQTAGSGFTTLDTTAAMTRYELRVLDNNYVILANDISILAGNMRDYTAFDASPVPFNPGFPYDRPSFLFFGDDTGSGEASVDLARISSFDSVPEPEADFDRDNDIDGHDLLIWQRGFGISGGAMQEQGDANRDGTVNGEDLAIWEQQVGKPHLLAPPLFAGATNMAIPEPTSMFLMLLAGLLMFSRMWPAGFC